MMTNSSIKLGLIAFANDGGLGAQTRRLAEFLVPEKVMVIDSSDFSKNKDHHFEWYPKDKTMVTKGFPKNYEVLQFIEGLTHVFTCENPYNFYLVKACQERGIKLICQTNYEFCENLDSPHLPLPDIFLMPSYWKLEEMQEKYGVGRVRYLPPIMNEREFSMVRDENMNRIRSTHKSRFAHIVGTLAWKDRNGTLDLLASLKYCKQDFELIIKSQHPLPGEYITSDSRVTYQIGPVEKNAELYRGFDGLILPRRYGGLCLTMNEALMCAVPVMMSDISPNNQALYDIWLVPAKKEGEFKARAAIEYFSVNPKLLAEKIDEWAVDRPNKEVALHYGHRFSYSYLRSKYNDLFQE